MNVTVAIDSLKGSLSSMEAGFAIRDGIHQVFPHARVTVCPLADGGEGTVEALIAGFKGSLEKVEVTGPSGKKVFCSYGVIKDKKLAIIEMAGAAGITQVWGREKNPLHTTTYGVGEVILDAIQKGCRKFIVGIGGSATNDGGMGMLRALGVQFLDKAGNELLGYGRDLNALERIQIESMNPELSQCDFRIACDVTNPLFGVQGAAYVYGPQKGASEEEVRILDEGLKNLDRVVQKCLNKKAANIHGAGAAGGMGYAFSVFLNGKLEPGIDIILDAIQLETAIKDSDYVITGEGRLDSQTAMGKAPIGVARLAKKHNKKVLAFAGCLTKDACLCNENGIDAYFSILRTPCTVEEAMEKECARENMKATVEQVFRLL